MCGQQSEPLPACTCSVHVVSKVHVVSTPAIGSQVLDGCVDALRFIGRAEVRDHISGEATRFVLSVPLPVNEGDLRSDQIRSDQIR